MTLTNHSLNPAWVLLDTQSSCDIFNNSELLVDIKVEKGQGLQLHSNGTGLIETNQQGTVQGYGKVWYLPKSLANIMSFTNVRKKFKINISTGPGDKEPVITVTKSNGSPMHFKEISNGLYVYDASDDILQKNKSTLKSNYQYSLVSTVKQNEQNFTPREIKAAQAAIKLSHKIGRPSHQICSKIIS